MLHLYKRVVINVVKVSQHIWVINVRVVKDEQSQNDDDGHGV